MDRAKTGTKRSLLVEGGGVPVGLSVAGANRVDFKRLEETLQAVPVKKPIPTKRHPQHLNLDKGYDYEEVRALLQAHGLMAHIRSRKEEAKEKGSPARRRAAGCGRAHSFLVQPFSQPPHALVQESQKLLGHALLRLRLDRLPGCRVIRIGT